MTSDTRTAGPHTTSRRRSLAALLVLAAFAPAVWAGGVPDARLPSGRFSLPAPVSAPTPPMGWNPWNAFRTEVTEDKIIAVARSLKNTGLADAGYRYVNIDDGWWLARRADGRIEIRTSMFPSAAVGHGQTSFRPFVERLHDMGLKAGIYTDIGRNACSQAWDARSPNLPVGTRAEREVGSYGHQAEDMRLIFGEWGFDFIKVDACGLSDYTLDKKYVRDGEYRAFGPYIVRHEPAQSDERKVGALYADLRKAIAAARPDGDYVLSICTWGEASVADWAKAYGNQWRTSPDISANWKSMLRNFDSAAGRALYAGPGRWNDPDMLEVGIGQFDAGHLTEARTHMSLWAIIGAPLILGGQRHDNGLGVLANSRLEVRLDGGFQRFLASAGRITDAGADLGTRRGAEAARPALRYQVYGDGKLLFDKAGAQAEAIDVPVRGVKTLELVVRGAAGPAVPLAAAWADARLTR